MHRADTTNITSSGVVKTGGISTISSAIITGLTSATDINVGDWVTMDNGFLSQRYKVIATAATQITLLGVATSSETGITVTVVANMYTQGDGVAVNRTIYGPDQANAVQEEISNLIIGADLSLDKTNNQQLLASVVPVTGGTFSGALAAQSLTAVASVNGATIQSSGDVKAANDVIAVRNAQAKNFKLTATVVGTLADSTANIKTYGGRYTIDDLAVATQVKLFTFVPAISAAPGEFIKLRVDITLSGLESYTKIDVSVKLDNTEKLWVNSLLRIANFSSDTPEDIRSYYNYIVGTNVDSLVDGTGAKNASPLILIKSDGVYLRNTHTSVALEDVELFVEVDRTE